LEFVTVALEYCRLLETANKETLFSFTDKAVKLIPLLYLKATLLPETPEIEDFDEDEYGYEEELETFITEDAYDTVRLRIENIVNEHDMFLVTSHPDMQFSDTPVAVHVSEYLADTYQSVGDFLGRFRLENETVMYKALKAFRSDFCAWWGQELLNTLGALHHVRYVILSESEDNNYLTEEDVE